MRKDCALNARTQDTGNVSRTTTVQCEVYTTSASTTSANSSSYVVPPTYLYSLRLTLYPCFCYVQLSQPTIFLSHDWPQGIEHHGDLRDLLRRKPYFRDDINKGVLGSPPLMSLLHSLRPRWWFSAHLHCRFEAAVVHGTPADGLAGGGSQTGGGGAEGTNPDEITIDDEDDADGGAVNVNAPVPETKTENAPPSRANPDEITLDDEEDEVEAPPLPPPPPTITNFLALDKCLPKRQFLEVRIFPCFSLPSV